MLYTVVIDTGDAGQDEVLEQLERLPAVVSVRLMGPVRGSGEVELRGLFESTEEGA
jgi:hypothetical protein